jgi:hypothetical protein
MQSTHIPLLQELKPMLMSSQKAFTAVQLVKKNPIHVPIKYNIRDIVECTLLRSCMSHIVAA